MKINATPFQVLEGKDVDLAQWATRSKPLCKSKKAYRNALEDQVEALSEQQRQAQYERQQAMLAKEGGKLGKVVEYASYPEAYQDLALKRTDFVVNTVINLKALVAERPNVFELGQPVSGNSYPAWAVKKGNTDLQKFMNDFIAAQKANGVMPALQKKWFGEAFTLPVSYTPEQ